MDAGRFHEHYLLQAGWLAPARRYLFRKAGVAGRQRILDLGCGSGIIAEELRQACGRPVLAVDRDAEMVALARRLYPGNEYRSVDERRLLKEGRRFDLVVLSFVLMWQRRPLPFLKRVRGLLEGDGALLLLAEPDYGGRIDQPADLDFLGELFAGSIRREGGDPFIGRKLAALLRRAGFRAEVELASALRFPRTFAGEARLGAEAPARDEARSGAEAPARDEARLGAADPTEETAWEREWRFWQELAGVSDETLKDIQRREKNAIARGARMVFFPVFCALARP